MRRFGHSKAMRAYARAPPLPSARLRGWGEEAEGTAFQLGRAAARAGGDDGGRYGSGSPT